MLVYGHLILREGGGGVPGADGMVVGEAGTGRIPEDVSA